MNKEQINALVRKFGKKCKVSVSIKIETDGFGELRSAETRKGGLYETMIAPIRIGDILQKRDMEFWLSEHNEGISNCDFLYIKWFYCGITKGLEQIIKDSGWKMDKEKFAKDLKTKDGGAIPQVLKSKQATELFEFLSLVSQKKK